MKLNELKSELQEKEKGCGRLMGFPADNPRVKCGDNCKTIQGKRICGFCKAKIEYLKKGISACEEILNSQQLKSEVSENSSLSEEAQTKGIVGEFNNNVKETSVETAGNPLGFSSQSADTQTLTQQLEDKKKGCGIDLGAYMEVPKEYENAPDKIRKEKSFRVEVICGKQEYCPTCKSNIAILEQAIAEIKKQRQEIIEDIKTLGRNNKAYYSMIDGKNHIDICIEDVEQLNQPKEEKDGS